jgi:hypothetical protein
MARHFLKEALLPEDANKVVHLQFTPYPYFNPEYVERIIDELSKKEFLVKAGLDDFTECEKLAFRLLYESAIMAGTLPEIERKAL